MTDPYRKTQALVPVALHEAAACQWCRWSENNLRTRECEHPVSGGPSRLYCKDANPRGQCVHFSPSMLTRLLRRVGLRAPAMVDPGVWDPSRWGPFSRLKPTAHARDNGTRCGEACYVETMKKPIPPANVGPVQFWAGPEGRMIVQPLENTEAARVWCRKYIDDAGRSWAQTADTGWLESSRYERDGDPVTPDGPSENPTLCEIMDADPAASARMDNEIWALIDSSPFAVVDHKALIEHVIMVQAKSPATVAEVMAGALKSLLAIAKAESDAAKHERGGRWAYEVADASKARTNGIIDKAREMSRATSSTMEAAIVALIDSGAELHELEIVSMARDPSDWRVRMRRNTCDCGRAV